MLQFSLLTKPMAEHGSKQIIAATIVQGCKILEGKLCIYDTLVSLRKLSSNMKKFVELCRSQKLFLKLYFDREKDRIKKYLINSKDYREVDTNLKTLKIESKVRDQVINEYWKQCDILYSGAMT